MPTLDHDAIDAIVEARHGDAFGVLGPHEEAGALMVRAFVPGAERLELLVEGQPPLSLPRIREAGFFEGRVTGGKAGKLVYRLRAGNEGGEWEFDDPYRFGPYLGEIDSYLMREGTHRRLYEKLGAHLIEHEGVKGVHFAVWAPDASRVAVVGSFNDWDGRRHPMRRHLDTGVWSIFIPGLGEGGIYKYEIRAGDGSLLPLKADPVGFAGEFRPATGSVVRQVDRFTWGDGDWLAQREKQSQLAAPVSVYEVHLGSWRRGEDNRFLTYDELGDQLVP
jgi:1,4-alpha-glucan branching enzyme